MKLLPKLKAWILNIEIRKRFIFFYVFLVFLPACIGIIIYYQKISEITEEEFNESILQTIEQAEINITYRLENIVNLSNIVAYNPNLYQLLTSTNSSSYEQWQDFRELEKLIDGITSTQKSNNFRLFVNPKLMYSREQIHFFSLEELHSLDWFNNMERERGNLFWKTTYFQEYIDRQDGYIISCVRVLRNPKNYEEIIGVLLIDIYEKDFYNIISNTILSMEQQVYIVDNNGIIISHSNKSLVGNTKLSSQIIHTMDKDTKGFFKEQVGDKSNHFIYKQIPLTNWSIVSEVPAGSINKNSDTFNKISGIVFLIGTIIFFILILFLGFASSTHKTNQRIWELTRILNTEGLIGIDNKLDRKSGDLEELEYNIKSIIQTVELLTAKSYKAQLKERESSLRALQAQINPHFLYNTLDTINWMAIKLNAKQISRMIILLSNYFRMSLNSGRDIITIREEVELTKSYINIQNIRFENSFKVTYQIDDAVKNIEVPKLIMQPIIENSILHGIQGKKEKKGNINITVKLINNMLVIKIMDDGIGMNQEVLNKLGKSNGYGLKNIKERLKLFAGSDSKLEIDSNLGVGTVVTIIISVNKNEVN
nr:sensor histidine kinase [Paenibacillus bovis]